MKLDTASLAVSFAKKLEDDSAKLYEKLVRKYPEGKQAFLSLIEENRQNKSLVDRAYYGAITDAIESCFAFEGIDTGDFAITTGLPEDADYSDALNIALQMEEKIVRFYSIAGETSKPLMGDVARAFEKIAKKRGDRIQKLRSLSLGTKS
jgi:rubrerythrin